MHACLNVDEIVRLIASKLVGPGSRATAVALACCRKSFENPVLDVLWETQGKLIPLLKSLPGDVWNGSGCAVGDQPHTYSFPLTVLFKSLSRDSRQRRNGLVSGSMLEGCESLRVSAMQAPSLRRCSRYCSSAPPPNPCFQISELLTCGLLRNPFHLSPCSSLLEPPPSAFGSLYPIYPT